MRLSDSIENNKEEDHWDPAARSSPSLIAKISVWMAESSKTSLLNKSKLFPWWSLKRYPMPLLEDTVEKETSILILIQPIKGGTQDILREGHCQTGAEIREGSEKISETGRILLSQTFFDHQKKWNLKSSRQSDEIAFSWRKAILLQHDQINQTNAEKVRRQDYS